MPTTAGLNLVLYDRTCRGRWGVGLSRAWQGGSHLYRALGRADAAFGAGSWEEGLTWLATHQQERPIAQVQYWGHGKWGRVFVADQSLDRTAFARTHPHHRVLERVRARLGPQALVWFRTCETLGAASGHGFAQACAEFFGCAVAGHTHIIGYWQSGLHRLQPGNRPHWSDTDGLLEGTPEAPQRARWSGPKLPCTISCLQSRVPAGF